MHRLEPRLPRFQVPRWGAWAEALIRVLLASWFWTMVWLVLYATVGSWALGSRAVVIEGRSMEPSIARGDVVLVSPITPEAITSLKAGNIVVFEDPAVPGRLITHRVMTTKADGSLITKGDANSGLDSTPVPSEAVRALGRMVIPIVGLPLVWRAEGQWLHLLAWIALTVCAYPASSGRWRWLSRVLGLEELPRSSPAAGLGRRWQSALAGSASTVLVVMLAVTLASRATASAPAPTVAPRPEPAVVLPAPPGVWDVVLIDDASDSEPWMPIGVGTEVGSLDERYYTASPGLSFTTAGRVSPIGTGLTRTATERLVRDFQLEAKLLRSTGDDPTDTDLVDAIGVEASDGSERLVVVNHGTARVSIVSVDPTGITTELVSGPFVAPVNTWYQVSFHGLAAGQMVAMLLDADGALLGRIAVPGDAIDPNTADPIFDGIVVRGSSGLVFDDVLLAGYRAAGRS